MRLIAVLFVFFSANTWSQTDSIPDGKHGVDYCVTDGQGKKQGYWVRVYESGSVYYTGQFKNGEPFGEFSYFYENGGLMAVNSHGDDGLVKNTSYRKSGSVISQGDYLNQKKHGKWMYYDEQGIVRALETYKSDVLDGEFKVFYYTGQVSEEGLFENGKREGIHKEYFVSGEIKSEAKFVAGLEQGEIKAWDSPNVKLYKGQMSNGVAVGEWHYYLPNGKIEYRILYDDSGKEIKRKFENGEQEEFYDSGIPKSYFEYKNGKKHGPFQEFYNKGDFVRREVMPEAQGESIERVESLENTQVKVEGEYRNGNLVGEVIYYLENGRIEKTEVYEQGVLIETIYP